MTKKSAAKALRSPKRGKRKATKGNKAASGKAVAHRSASARPKAAARSDAKAEIRRLKAQLAKAMARIDHLQAAAETDFLLGIPNRRGFERQLGRAISYIQRYHASGALIVLDVDRLKPINDRFGHAAGDQVLKTIVGVLARQIRNSDVVGRLGGDEFALLLWNLSETDAHAKAASLEDEIDRLGFAFAGKTVATGVSAGVVVLSAQSEARSALVEADCAMYVRKAQRRHERHAELPDADQSRPPASRAAS